MFKRRKSHSMVYALYSSTDSNSVVFSRSIILFISDYTIYTIVGDVNALCYAGLMFTDNAVSKYDHDATWAIIIVRMCRGGKRKEAK